MTGIFRRLMWWAWSSVGLANLVESYTFAVRVMENWNRLLKEVVESPTLDLFKSDLVMAPSTHLHVTLLEQGLDQLSSRGPFQPQPFSQWLLRILTSRLWNSTSSEHSQPSLAQERTCETDQVGSMEKKTGKSAGKEKDKEKWNDIENS